MKYLAIVFDVFNSHSKSQNIHKFKFLKLILLPVWNFYNFLINLQHLQNSHEQILLVRIDLGLNFD